MTERWPAQIAGIEDKVLIEDFEPTESAKLFWAITGSIWGNKPERLNTTCHGVSFPGAIEKARDEINRELLVINPELVISGIDRVLTLNNPQVGDTIDFSPEFLSKPDNISFSVFCWDSQTGSRYIEHKGRQEVAIFTDGHTDRHRELSIGFSYNNPVHRHPDLQIIYLIRRNQSNQDLPTSIGLDAWCAELAETGYEGTHIISEQNMGLDQELSLLRLVKPMVDMALEVRGPQS